MGQLRTNYRLIDDNEVDADSALTASLITALRDQWQGALCNVAGGGITADRVALPDRAKTVDTDQSKVLKPDGSGGVEWEHGKLTARSSSYGTGATSTLTINIDNIGLAGSIIMLTGGAGAYRFGGSANVVSGSTVNFAFHQGASSVKHNDSTVSVSTEVTTDDSNTAFHVQFTSISTDQIVIAIRVSGSDVASDKFFQAIGFTPN